jgi:hypothetical protein
VTAPSDVISVYKTFLNTTTKHETHNDFILYTTRICCAFQREREREKNKYTDRWRS